MSVEITSATSENLVTSSPTIDVVHTGDGIRIRYNPHEDLTADDSRSIEALCNVFSSQPSSESNRIIDELDALKAATACQRFFEIVDDLSDRVAEDDTLQHVSERLDEIGAALVGVPQAMQNATVNTLITTGGSEPIGTIARGAVSLATATGVINPGVVYESPVPTTYFEAMAEFGLVEQPKNFIEITLSSSEIAYVQSLIAGAVERNAQQLTDHEFLSDPEAVYEVIPFHLTEAEQSSLAEFFTSGQEETVVFSAKLDANGQTELTISGTGEPIGSFPSLHPAYGQYSQTIEQSGVEVHLELTKTEHNTYYTALRILGNYQTGGPLWTIDTLVTIDINGLPHYLVPTDAVPNSETAVVKVTEEMLPQLRQDFNSEHIQLGDLIIVQRSKDTNELIKYILTAGEVLIVEYKPSILGNNIRQSPDPINGQLLGTANDTSVLLQNNDQNRASIPAGVPINPTEELIMTIGTDGHVWYAIKFVDARGQIQVGWMQDAVAGEPVTSYGNGTPTPAPAPKKIAARLAPPPALSPADIAVRDQIYSTLPEAIRNQIEVGNVQYDPSRYGVVRLSPQGEIQVWRPGTTVENDVSSGWFIETDMYYSPALNARIHLEVSTEGITDRNYTNATFSEEWIRQFESWAPDPVHMGNRISNMDIYIQLVSDYNPDEASIDYMETYVRGGRSRTVQHALQVTKISNNVSFIRGYTPGYISDNTFHSKEEDEFVVSSLITYALYIAQSRRSNENISSMLVDSGSLVVPFYQSLIVNNHVDLPPTQRTRLVNLS